MCQLLTCYVMLYYVLYVCVYCVMKVYPPGEGGHLWGDNQQLIARPETTKVNCLYYTFIARSYVVA
jgi:hypothetical protein